MKIPKHGPQVAPHLQSHIKMENNINVFGQLNKKI